MFKKERKIWGVGRFSNSPVKGKRGQITVFIIIGILLLLGIALVLFMQQTTLQIKAKSQVAQDIVPLYTYVDACIKQIAEEDLISLGQNGGFIEYPLAIDKDPTAYISIHPELKDTRIPYWWHNNENRIPPDDFIVYQLQNSMDSKLRGCVKNFSDFDYLNITELADLKTEVLLAKSNVVYDVIWPMEIDIGDKVETIDRFTISKDIRLKKLLELSRNLMNKENEEGIFEDFTLDLIALDNDIPFTNYAMRCSPKIWFVNQVRDKLKRLLSVNIPLIRISNTDYREVPVKQEYVKNHYIYTIGEEDYPNMHVTFQYEPRAGFNFRVRPSNGLLMQSGMQQGKDSGVVDLSYLCMQIWHFTYDVKYPVIVTVRDMETERSNGYSFRFAFPVVIKQNQASRDIRASNTFDFEQAPISQEYCSETLDRSITVNTVNEVTGYDLPGADISFNCFKYNCNIGTTEWMDGGAIAGLNKPFPSCGGGVVKANAENYLEGKTFVDTHTENLVTVKLTPTKTIYNYSVVKHFVDSRYINQEVKLGSKERAIIVMKHGDYQTFGFYPIEEDETSIPSLSGTNLGEEANIPKLTLLADKDFVYDVKIYLISDDAFIGGYDAKWSASNNYISEGNEIKFHVASTINKLPEDSMEMQAFFTNLKSNSALIPAPEVK